MAGIATFPTMAYITAQLQFLPTEGTGMGFGAVFTATLSYLAH